MISICMPTRNREAYLAETIESILQQTHKDWELIIYDDGSTDDTETLMEYYTNLDNRIVYIKGTHKGIAGARNEAIRASRGDYIAVMDSDDIMNKERLKKSLKALKDVDFVYTSYLIADANGRPQAVHIPPTAKNINKDSIRNNDSYPHVTIVAKRHCFVDNPYREELKVNDDMGLMVDWFKAGYKAKRIKEALMLVRRHPGGVSVTKQKEVDKITKQLQEEIDEDSNNSRK